MDMIYYTLGNIKETNSIRTNTYDRRKIVMPAWPGSESVRVSEWERNLRVSCMIECEYECNEYEGDGWRGSRLSEHQRQWFPILLVTILGLYTHKYFFNTA